MGYRNRKQKGLKKESLNKKKLPKTRLSTSKSMLGREKKDKFVKLSTVNLILIDISVNFFKSLDREMVKLWGGKESQR